MNVLNKEIAAFLQDKEARTLDARLAAALQIACHFDLGEALKADAATRARIILKLERIIERERQRGARRHWSYDLNRHIALKQVLDRLCAVRRDDDIAGPKETALGSMRKKNRSVKENGAQRRRSKAQTAVASRLDVPSPR